MNELLRRIVPVVVGSALIMMLARSSPYTSRKDRDFESYWFAAKLACVDGQTAYGIQRLTAGADRWLPGHRKALPFLYAPPALLAMCAESPFDVSDAAAILMVLNCIAAGIAFAFMFRALQLWEPRRLRWSVVVYLGMFAPLYTSISFGQVDAVLLVMLCGAWHAYRSGRSSILGGAALALTAFFKVHYGLFLVLGMLRSRRRWIAATVGFGVIGVAASMLWFSFDAWGGWLTDVVGDSSLTKLPQGISSIAAPWNLSVPALTARFLVTNPFYSTWAAPSWIATAVPALLTALIGGWTAFVVWRSTREREASQRLDAEVCLVLAAAFLMSPISWGTHLVFVLPAILFIVKHVVFDPTSRRASRIALGVVAIILAPEPQMFGLPTSGSIALVIATARSLAAVGIWLGLSLWLHRKRGSD